MSELDLFLAEVKQEGQPIAEVLADKEKDTPADSPPANEPEEEAKKEEPKEGEETKVENTPKEEDLPFHKHPRWIEREKELNTFRERDEQTAKELAELKAFKEEISSRVTPSTEIPEWFKELHGDNEFAYKKYVEHEQKRDETIKARVIEEQKVEQQKAKDEEVRWSKWVDDEIGKLSSAGKQFDRNELIQTILKYKPTDENNNFDFNAGFEIYQALRKEDPAKSQARKELADTATRSTKSDKPTKDYLTPSELRNKSWFQL